MDLGISGKRALVLAGTGGLGAAIARALVAEGCEVVITGRRQEAAEAAAGAMSTGTEGTVTGLGCDLGSADSIDRMLEALFARHDGADILVNLTGGPPPGPIADAATETLRAHFDALVLGLVRITNALLPGMRRRKWGRILTSASSGVIQPIPNLGISNMLRAALITWSKTLSAEVAADGVTVNVIVPGRILTRRVEALDQVAAGRRGVPVDDVVAESQAAIPMRRYGTPGEFASVAAFLVSAPASYVTGSVVRVDGGMIRSV